MELTKNIFFNTDKLLQNSTIKISYIGKLFENNSKEVYIHYGFGLLWDNLSEIKMEKTEIGFQIEVDLVESETFNFCFRDENEAWDNNNTENYIFELEKPNVELILSSEEISLDKPNRLRKTYIWSKKVRLAVYKIITYLPKLISGNYRRKVDNED
jgi:hypothetical protein